MKRKQILLASALLSLLTAGSASASLLDLGPGSFTAQASVITFSEAGVPLGTANPSYTLSTASLGSVTISFDGTFKGQTTQFLNGGVVQTLLNSTPSGPLTLNTSGPGTFTANDSAMPTAPILSGTPQYNGPISILFSTPVAGVGLIGGYFDAANSTTIQAYDASGNVLGSITNPTTGDIFFGLADSTGAADISGVSFFVTGNEPFGFDIDNVTFGAASEVILPTSAPEPTSLSLSIIGALGVIGTSVRKIHRKRR